MRFRNLDGPGELFGYPRDLDSEKVSETHGFILHYICYRIEIHSN
jgi:hypothetical protein